MSELLIESLKESETPEFLSMIKESIDLFDLYELADYKLEYDELVMTHDVDEVLTYSQRVYNLTTKFQEIILDQHLILVNDDADISIVNTILRGLYLIESTEYVEEILSICEHEKDPTVAFCNILNIVTSTDVETFLLNIQNVEISMINKIIEVLSSRLNESIELVDIDLVRRKIDIYKDFVNANSLESEPLINKFIKENRIYLGQFETTFDTLVDELRNLKPNQAAFEVVCIALLSTDLPALFKDVVKSKGQYLYENLDKVTEYCVSVDQKILEFDKIKNSGIKKVD